MSDTIQTTVGAYRTRVAPVWGRCGVFTRSLSSFGGPARDAADAAGFKAVAVQLDNTPLAQANIDELLRLRPEFTRKGWKVVGWATAGQLPVSVQPSDVVNEGIRQRALWRKYALDGWITNIETWGEGLRKWVSAAWMQGFMLNTIGTPPALMLSCLSSVTNNYGRDMDYTPFVDYAKCSISPQCYSASDPAYTLTAMRASFAKTSVPRDRIAPTCNVVKGQPIPTRYKRWRGCRWLYTGDDVGAPTDFTKILVPGGCL